MAAWYAIHCENEASADRLARQLGAKGVMAATHQLSLAGAPVSCAIFPEEDCARALGGLGLPQNLPTTPLDDANYSLVLDRPVISLLPDCSNARAAAAVAKAFARDLGIKIVMTHGWGASLPAAQKIPGVLRIYSYAVPQQAGVQPHVTQLGAAFGTTLPNANLLSPTGIGSAIQTTPEGYMIAEAVNGSLFILVDLVYAPIDSETIFVVLSKILEGFIELQNPNPCVQPGETDPKQEYIRICSGRTRLREALLDFRLHEVEAELQRASKLLALKSAEQEQILTELYALRQRKGSVLDDYAREYDQLAANPHVKKITIEGGKIHVMTDEIFLTYDGETRCLGRFDIYIPVQGGNVAILNKSPKRSADGQIFHHPHIYGAEGGGCLAELAQSIASHIARRKYAEVVQLIISFLHQFNPLEAYVAALRLWEPLRRPRPCSCEIRQKDNKGVKP